MRACMGGWCERRDVCPHYLAPMRAVSPSERLCDPCIDGAINGKPMQVWRSIGTWERRDGFIDLARGAGPFDGLQR